MKSNISYKNKHRLNRPKPNKHLSNTIPLDDSKGVLLSIERNLKIQSIIREIPKTIICLCIAPTVYEMLNITKRFLSRIGKIPITPEDAVESLKTRIGALR